LTLRRSATSSFDSNGSAEQQSAFLRWSTAAQQRAPQSASLHAGFAAGAPRRTIGPGFGRGSRTRGSTTGSVRGTGAEEGGRLQASALTDMARSSSARAEPPLIWAGFLSRLSPLFLPQPGRRKGCRPDRNCLHYKQTHKLRRWPAPSPTPRSRA